MPEGPPTNAAHSLCLARWFAIALTLLMLLSACRTDVSIDAATAPPSSEASATNTDPTAAPEPSETGDEASDDAPPEEVPEAGEAGDTGDTGEAGDTGDDEAPEPSEDTDPLFELRGDLPLSTSDVNGLIEFIEAETGREFLRPPVIVAQNNTDFEAGLAPDEEQLAEFLDVADNNARFLQALGLTTQGAQEITDAFLALFSSSEGILGYYDPEIDELYVPNDVLADVEFQGVLVHELTHALDGQHSDLTRLEQLSDEADVTGNYEPVTAYQTVVEGRATSVEFRWFEATGNPPPEPDDDLGLAADVPPAILIGISIPYGSGQVFIESNGGPGNTWDLLENPPLWTEEVIVPGVGIGVESTIDVPVPAADGAVLDEQVFGASDILVLLLGENLEPDPSLIFPTFGAIDGWAGGSSVLWGDEAESCVRIAIAADSGQDLSEIELAFEQWASDVSERVVSLEDELVVATGCAPYIP